ncbi:hypothetical protein PLUTE_a4421 [Pseudoalteromonas luteoviolacea DSM 6061]|nr:hypothetical protein [Pseudoalteromonas luteoviolacea DSM 6061]
MLRLLLLSKEVFLWADTKGTRVGQIAQRFGFIRCLFCGV